MEGRHCPGAPDYREVQGTDAERCHNPPALQQPRAAHYREVRSADAERRHNPPALQQPRDKPPYLKRIRLGHNRVMEEEASNR